MYEGKSPPHHFESSLLAGVNRSGLRSGDGSSHILSALLLLAAGKNGNSRKSENSDGLHIYLTWYIWLSFSDPE